MKIGLRTIGFGIALALAGLLVFVTLRGPHGLPALHEKEQRARELQEQNAKLARENQLKRDHIRKLRENQSEQELEIRRRLKLLKEKETTFIIQDPQHDKKPAQPQQ
jgi:cell division protein FtsB